MPKQAENTIQPTETPAGPEATPTPKVSRRGGRKAAANEEPTPESAETAQPGGAEGVGAGRLGGGTPLAASSDARAAAPADDHNGQATDGALAGLRGGEYVKALVGHPLTTLNVPLQTNERRGDWERSKGQKVPVTSRQVGDTSGHWLERDHALSGVIVVLERPGATRYDQLPLKDISARQAIEHLSDYMNQTRLRAQTQTGKKWTATHLYLIPVEDAEGKM